jgi:hypothetical protein
MRHRISPFAAILIVAIHSAACSDPDRPAWLSLDPNQWANRSESDEPIAIDVIGPVAVDVESFNGDVMIRGNPELEQAQVTIVRAGVHGFDRIDESKRALQEIAYGAEVVPGQLGQVLRVQTSTTHAEPHYLRAHVFIELPDVNGVKVRTTNGRVYLRNVQGPIDVSTSEQDVRIMTNLMMNQPVTIVNRDGDIDYRVRGESQGRFDARTVNGRVSQLVRFGNSVVEPRTSDDALRATLNNGANPIILRTVNGDIRIAVVHNPEQVGANIVN